MIVDLSTVDGINTARIQIVDRTDRVQKMLVKTETQLRKSRHLGITVTTRLTRKIWELEDSISALQISWDQVNRAADKIVTNGITGHDNVIEVELS